MNEYRRRFIETAAPLDRLSDDILLGQFINGLKEEVKAEVRLLSPMNLEQAMEMAIRVEEKQHISNSRRKFAVSVKTGAYSSYSRGTSAVGSYSTSFSPSPTISQN